MKEPNQLSLGDAIKAFIQQYRLGDKLTQTRIKDLWERLMGRNIAAYTLRLELKNKRLTVYLSSSVLRNELHMGRSKICEMINRELGQDLIEEVDFR